MWFTLWQLWYNNLIRSVFPFVSGLFSTCKQSDSHFKYESRTELKHTQKSHIKDRNNSSGDVRRIFYSSHMSQLPSSEFSLLENSIEIYIKGRCSNSISACVEQKCLLSSMLRQTQKKKHVLSGTTVEVVPAERLRWLWSLLSFTYWLSLWHLILIWSYWCGETLHVRLLFHLRSGNSL